MYPHHAVQTLACMKRHAGHVPLKPEEGVFYRAFNGSLAYVYKLDDDDGEALACILKGGFLEGEHGRTPPVRPIV